MLILFYRRRFRELGYSRHLHEVWCLCLFQGRVAGLLRPRPFLNKLSNALVSRKFCEQHSSIIVLNDYVTGLYLIIGWPGCLYVTMWTIYDVPNSCYRIHENCYPVKSRLRSYKPAPSPGQGYHHCLISEGSGQVLQVFCTWIAWWWQTFTNSKL